MCDIIYNKERAKVKRHPKPNLKLHFDFAN